MNQIITQMEKY